MIKELETVQNQSENDNYLSPLIRQHVTDSDADDLVQYCKMQKGPGNITLKGGDSGYGEAKFRRAGEKGSRGSEQSFQNKEDLVLTLVIVLNGPVDTRPMCQFCCEGGGVRGRSGSTMLMM